MVRWVCEHCGEARSAGAYCVDCGITRQPPPTCKHCHEQHDTGVVCGPAAAAGQPYATDTAAMLRGQIDRGAELHRGVAAQAVRACVAQLQRAGFSDDDLREVLRLARRELG